MEINAQGNYDSLWLQKVAEQLTQTNVEISLSPVPTQSHCIQLKKIGLLGQLPEHVNPEYWTTQEDARKLQDFS
jgi:hypothetical protein